MVSIRVSSSIPITRPVAPSSRSTPVASGTNMTASAADVPVTLFGADTILVLQMEVPVVE